MSLELWQTGAQGLYSPDECLLLTCGCQASAQHREKIIVLAGAKCQWGRCCTSLPIK